MQAPKLHDQNVNNMGGKILALAARTALWCSPLSIFDICEPSLTTLCIVETCEQRVRDTPNACTPRDRESTNTTSTKYSMRGKDYSKRIRRSCSGKSSATCTPRDRE